MINTMNQLPARNTHIMMVALDTAAFRFPQPADKFTIKLTTDARQYVIINKGHKNPTTSIVTFAVSSTGTKLASCTCYDFANIKAHSRQCKHIHVAYNYHVARMAARKAAETVAAVEPAKLYTETAIYRKSAQGSEFIGKIRIS
jgi:hypothetical protein